jgi:hypothetical protein
MAHAPAHSNETAECGGVHVLCAHCRSPAVGDRRIRLIYLSVYPAPDGEYQYVCTTDQIIAKNCFGDIQMYQLFDLVADPYELNNIYNSTDTAILKELATRMRAHYPCQGVACP